MANNQFVVINTFKVKQGHMEAFLEEQSIPLPLAVDMKSGLRSSRLFRAHQEDTAVLVSVFESEDDFRRIAKSEELAARRKKILPLIEAATPLECDLIHQVGS
jgi:heme-degrading monooxygenase HmoA